MTLATSLPVPVPSLLLTTKLLKNARRTCRLITDPTSLIIVDEADGSP